MQRRIICWLTADPCSLVAAHFAVRENNAALFPFELLVIADDDITPEWHATAESYLRVPVTKLLSDAIFLSDDREPVHVIGIPADEQSKYDAFTSMHMGLTVVTPLADRALRRADCLELLRRAQVGKGVLDTLRKLAVVPATDSVCISVTGERSASVVEVRA